ncbi:AtpZ/AtpI family protein [Tropicimonas isoalkanivorans]|uniref:ATP synthase protein I n=1 Tax=Tropicimonas isoalkanivorans TaxID=441112 RepID=A0A1I1JPV2_9RHOB|nr:AtpZ/AtpI family protein [Tropicimonas isoalkanivorans]SFC50425.1 ATP synthase protein I [Tropicimonas isoalkanivorans]
MAEDSDSERLRRLEERIAAARGEEATGSPAADKYNQANVAWRMVTELVAGIVIGLGIGLGLDALLGTKPFLLVLFILLGLVAGIKTMMRTANEIQKSGATGAGEDIQAADAADEKQAAGAARDERD